MQPRTTIQFPLHLGTLTLSVIATFCLSSCSTAKLGTSPQGVATPSKAVQAASAPSLGAGAGLEDLVSFALQNHPDIHAAEANVRLLLARVPQAASLPDPKLKLGGGSMAETAAGRIEWMTGVEQALPYPGKLRELARAAGKEAEAATQELAAVRLRVAADVRKAYWHYYLARRTTEITSENLKALALVQESADARVAANRGSQEDQLRLANEAGKQDKMLIESRQAEASARSRLNALLDRPSGAALPAPVFQAAPQKEDLAILQRRAQQTHPNVRAAAAHLQASQHRLKRAQLDRLPDFTLGLQHAAVSNSGLAPSANGRDQLFATLGITLPLWQAPRRGKIEEAASGIEGAAAELRSQETTLRHLLEDAWLRAQSAETLIALFDRQILPEAQQAFDSVLSSYAAGSQSFVDALDAWRQLLAFQLQQAANQSQLGQAMADLKFATGEPSPK